MKKLFLSLTLLVFTSNAFAWGEREQSALAGFITGVVVTKILKPKPQPRYNPDAGSYQAINDCSNNPWKVFLKFTPTPNPTESPIIIICFLLLKFSIS